jgi:hypothetical protein
MNRIDFDHHDFAALGILIGVCDRRLGRQSAVSRALHRLRDEPTRTAYDHAQTAFDELSVVARSGLLEQAKRAAKESRQAVTDVQKQLNGLLGALNRRPAPAPRTGS